MQKLLVVATALVYVQGHVHPVNQQIIAEIKKKATTWEPMELEDNPLHHLSMSAVQGLLGTIFDADVPASDGVLTAVGPSGTTVPASFDART